MNDAALNAAAVDAIHAGRLAVWAESSDHPLAARALRTCARIARDLETERERLGGLLAAAGVTVGAPTAPGGAQRRLVTLEITAADLDRAVTVLTAAGYRRDHAWERGADRSFRAVAGRIDLHDAGADSTTVVRVRWDERRRGRWARLVTPTPADWAAVTLPNSLWRAYPAVRVARLAAERAGLRSRDHGRLEPFLVTPSSLIGPVLDVAGVGSDDVVFDFGCGDGRFLVEAVRAHGCRAIGVEQAPQLVSEARAKVADAGLDDRIIVVRGDAANVMLDDVTVIVLFVPMVVARRVLPTLLRRARPGTRIVLHEQSALPIDLPTPERTVPIITDDAVTVAHRWSAAGPGGR